MLFLEPDVDCFTVDLHRIALPQDVLKLQAPTAAPFTEPPAGTGGAGLPAIAYMGSVDPNRVHGPPRADAPDARHGTPPATGDTHRPATNHIKAPGSRPAHAYEHIPMQERADVVHRALLSMLHHRFPHEDTDTLENVYVLVVTHMAPPTFAGQPLSVEEVAALTARAALRDAPHTFLPAELRLRTFPSHTNAILAPDVARAEVVVVGEKVKENGHGSGGAAGVPTAAGKDSEKGADAAAGEARPPRPTTRVTASGEAAEPTAAEVGGGASATQTLTWQSPPLFFDSYYLLARDLTPEQQAVYRRHGLRLGEPSPAHRAGARKEGECGGGVKRCRRPRSAVADGMVGFSVMDGTFIHYVLAEGGARRDAPTASGTTPPSPASRRVRGIASRSLHFSVYRIPLSRFKPEEQLYYTRQREALRSRQHFAHRRRGRVDGVESSPTTTGTTTTAAAAATHAQTSKSWCRRLLDPLLGPPTRLGRRPDRAEEGDEESETDFSGSDNGVLEGGARGVGGAHVGWGMTDAARRRDDETRDVFARLFAAEMPERFGVADADAAAAFFRTCNQILTNYVGSRIPVDGEEEEEAKKQKDDRASSKVGGGAPSPETAKTAASPTPPGGAQAKPSATPSAKPTTVGVTTPPAPEEGAGSAGAPEPKAAAAAPRAKRTGPPAHLLQRLQRKTATAATATATAERKGAPERDGQVELEKKKEKEAEETAAVRTAVEEAARHIEDARARENSTGRTGTNPSANSERGHRRLTRPRTFPAVSHLGVTRLLYSLIPCDCYHLVVSDANPLYYAHSSRAAYRPHTVSLGLVSDLTMTASPRPADVAAAAAAAQGGGGVHRGTSYAAPVASTRTSQLHTGGPTRVGLSTRPTCLYAEHGSGAGRAASPGPNDANTVLLFPTEAAGAKTGGSAGWVPDRTGRVHRGGALADGLVSSRQPSRAASPERPSMAASTAAAAAAHPTATGAAKGEASDGRRRRRRTSGGPPKPRPGASFASLSSPTDGFVLVTASLCCNNISGNPKHQRETLQGKGISLPSDMTKGTSGTSGVVHHGRSAAAAASTRPRTRVESSSTDSANAVAVVNLFQLLAKSSLAQHRLRYGAIRPVVSVAVLESAMADSRGLGVPDGAAAAAAATPTARTAARGLYDEGSLQSRQSSSYACRGLTDHTWFSLPVQRTPEEQEAIQWMPVVLGATDCVSDVGYRTAVHLGVFPLRRNRRGGGRCEGGGESLRPVGLSGEGGGPLAGVLPTQEGVAASLSYGARESAAGVGVGVGGVSTGERGGVAGGQTEAAREPNAAVNPTPSTAAPPTPAAVSATAPRPQTVRERLAQRRAEAAAAAAAAAADAGGSSTSTRPTNTTATTTRTAAGGVAFTFGVSPSGPTASGADVSERPAQASATPRARTGTAATAARSGRTCVNVWDDVPIPATTHTPAWDDMPTRAHRGGGGAGVCRVDDSSGGGGPRGRAHTPPPPPPSPPAAAAAATRARAARGHAWEETPVGGRAGESGGVAWPPTRPLRHAMEGADRPTRGAMGGAHVFRRTVEAIDAERDDDAGERFFDEAGVGLTGERESRANAPTRMSYSFRSPVRRSTAAGPPRGPADSPTEGGVSASVLLRGRSPGPSRPTAFPPRLGSGAAGANVAASSSLSGGGGPSNPFLSFARPSRAGSPGAGARWSPFAHRPPCGRSTRSTRAPSVHPYNAEEGRGAVAEAGDRWGRDGDGPTGVPRFGGFESHGRSVGAEGRDSAWRGAAAARATVQPYNLPQRSMPHGEDNRWSHSFRPSISALSGDGSSPPPPPMGLGRVRPPSPSRDGEGRATSRPLWPRTPPPRPLDRRTPTGFFTGPVSYPATLGAASAPGGLHCGGPRDGYYVDEYSNEPESLGRPVRPRGAAVVDAPWARPTLGFSAARGARDTSPPPPSPLRTAAHPHGFGNPAQSALLGQRRPPLAPRRGYGGGGGGGGSVGFCATYGPSTATGRAHPSPAPFTSSRGLLLRRRTANSTAAFPAGARGAPVDSPIRRPVLDRTPLGGRRDTHESFSFPPAHRPPLVPGSSAASASAARVNPASLTLRERVRARRLELERRRAAEDLGRTVQDGCMLGAPPKRVRLEGTVGLEASPLDLDAVVVRSLLAGGSRAGLAGAAAPRATFSRGEASVSTTGAAPSSVLTTGCRVDGRVVSEAQRRLEELAQARSMGLAHIPNSPMSGGGGAGHGARSAACAAASRGAGEGLAGEQACLVDTLDSCDGLLSSDGVSISFTLRDLAHALLELPTRTSPPEHDVCRGAWQSDGVSYFVSRKPTRLRGGWDSYLARLNLYQEPFYLRDRALVLVLRVPHVPSLRVCVALHNINDLLSLLRQTPLAKILPTREEAWLREREFAAEYMMDSDDDRATSGDAGSSHGRAATTTRTRTSPDGEYMEEEVTVESRRFFGLFTSQKRVTVRRRVGACADPRAGGEGAPTSHTRSRRPQDITSTYESDDARRSRCRAMRRQFASDGLRLTWRHRLSLLYTQARETLRAVAYNDCTSPLLRDPAAFRSRVSFLSDRIVAYAAVRDRIKALRGLRNAYITRRAEELRRARVLRITEGTSLVVPPREPGVGQGGAGHGDGTLSTRVGGTQTGRCSSDVGGDGSGKSLQQVLAERRAAMRRRPSAIPRAPPAAAAAVTARGGCAMTFVMSTTPTSSLPGQHRGTRTAASSTVAPWRSLSTTTAAGGAEAPVEERRRGGGVAFTFDAGSPGPMGGGRTTATTTTTGQASSSPPLSSRRVNVAAVAPTSERKARGGISFTWDPSSRANEPSTATETPAGVDRAHVFGGGSSGCGHVPGAPSSIAPYFESGSLQPTRSTFAGEESGALQLAQHTDRLDLILQVQRSDSLAEALAVIAETKQSAVEPPMHTVLRLVPHAAQPTRGAGGGVVGPEDAPLYAGVVPSPVEVHRQLAHYNISVSQLQQLLQWQWEHHQASYELVPTPVFLGAVVPSTGQERARLAGVREGGVPCHGHGISALARVLLLSLVRWAWLVPVDYEQWWARRRRYGRLPRPRTRRRGGGPLGLQHRHIIWCLLALSAMARYPGAVLTLTLCATAGYLLWGTVREVLGLPTLASRSRSSRLHAWLPWSWPFHSASVGGTGGGAYDVVGDRRMLDPEEMGMSLRDDSVSLLYRHAEATAESLLEQQHDVPRQLVVTRMLQLYGLAGSLASRASMLVRGRSPVLSLFVAALCISYAVLFYTFVEVVNALAAGRSVWLAVVSPADALQAVVLPVLGENEAVVGQVLELLRQRVGAWAAAGEGDASGRGDSAGGGADVPGLTARQGVLATVSRMWRGRRTTRGAADKTGDDTTYQYFQNGRYYSYTMSSQAPPTAASATVGAAASEADAPFVNDDASFRQPPTHPTATSDRFRLEKMREVTRGESATASVRALWADLVDILHNATVESASPHGHRGTSQREPAETYGVFASASSAVLPFLLFAYVVTMCVPWSPLRWLWRRTWSLFLHDDALVRRPVLSF